MTKYGHRHLDKLLEKTVDQHGLGKQVFSNTIETNWFVFTGTYSAGKTTLIQDLAETLGVCYYEEPARKFITSKVRLGYKIKDIWADVQSTVMPVNKLRIDLERSLNPEQLVLLDTAIPDTLPYALLYGIDPEEIARASSFYRYKEPIYLVEPLPLKHDAVRNSHPQERLAVHYLRKEIYRILGYRVVIVPILNRGRRRDFVLQSMGKITESNT
jgi:predicted ATPase